MSRKQAEKLKVIVTLNGKMKVFNSVEKAQVWAKKRTERSVLRGKSFSCVFSTPEFVVEPVELVRFVPAPNMPGLSDGSWRDGNR